MGAGTQRATWLRIRGAWSVPILLLALLWSGEPHATARAASSITIAVADVRVTVRADGAFTIALRSPRWAFAGTLGGPLAALRAHAGSDRLGRFSEIDGISRGPYPAREAVRLYNARPTVLFTRSYLTAGPAASFPVLTGYPHGLAHLSYLGRFAVYTFGALSPDSPWLFFDGHDNAFMLSPVANPLVARTTRSANGALRGGIDPAIARLPRGFTQQTLLVAGHGINDVSQAWGRALTGLQGATRAGNEATASLRYLGYWTDTGAAYYYAYDRALGYAGTLLAVRAAFRRLHIPLGYLELDSWWYPKGPAASWQGSGVLRGGIARFEAAPALFPSGLAAFQRRLGLPLIVHARWIDPSSPYRRVYRTSGNVITDPRYWRQIAAYLHGAGVIAYEQDWLAAYAQPAMNLTDPIAFLDTMAGALRASGIDLLYCMPLARDLLQGALYPNLLGARVSYDHFTSRQWTRALYDARLDAALGLWPWDDVFRSGETDNLLLATLSAGIVGVGDPLGAIDAASLKRAIRGDGVLVKPDAPIVPTDDTTIADAAGLDRPMVAFAYSDHGAMRALYVFAYRRGRATQAAFRPASLGLSGRVYVYDYFAGTGRAIAPGATFRTTVGGGSYYIATPIGRSGIALLGDLARFASMGRQRIARLDDTGRIEATVTFGAGERSVTLSGYAPTTPLVDVRGGHAGAISFNRAAHLFQATITRGASQSAVVEMREPGTPPQPT